MDIIGIICEYNPFHNGHIYHIKKIKELFPNSLIIACVSSSFLERGEISIINKWDKTDIALCNGIDIVIELPFVFSSQSADLFAFGALKILNEVGVKKIVFGSESNDISFLTDIANTQISDIQFNSYVKDELNKGINYPTALANALKNKFDKVIDTPNDLLAISYIKEIIKNKYDITPISIQRTNDYHSFDKNSDIISASAIRNLIKHNEDISLYVPNDLLNKIYKNINYFNLLKYKIISDADLKRYQTVDEGIEKRLIKFINESNDIYDYISKIKTKRFTFNKINRMLIHILTSFTKEEARNLDVTYIRILGFNKRGRKYLSSIKKEVSIPIITSYKNMNDKNLDIEYRVNCIYSFIVNDNDLNIRELEKPVIK